MYTVNTITTTTRYIRSSDAHASNHYLLADVAKVGLKEEQWENWL